MKKLDKIYVIGFKNSPRYENFKEMFTDFNFELIEAVDASLVKGISELKNRRAPDCRPETNEFYDLFNVNGAIYKSAHNMTEKEVACAFAHMKVHRNIINHQFNNTLILEDDVLPSAGVHLIDNINFDFDFDILMLNKNINIPNFKIVKMRADTICSYIVKNANSAKKYLNCFKNGLLCADNPMSSDNNPLNVFCTTKSYFYHDSAQSIIDSKSKYFSNK